MTRALVTGATGFVGRMVCQRLADVGVLVRAALRRTVEVPVGADEYVVVGDIDSRTEWKAALAGVDVVVHLAARVHVLSGSRNDSALYEEVNHFGTRRLAEAGVESGVGRLVFLSTVKVNGEETFDSSFRRTDVPSPRDAYGVSKANAEAALMQIARAGGMQVAIVRPPLVYGPGVRANFLRLMQWIERGVPLPLGSVDNRRSLISLWNLADLISHLVTRGDPSSGIWMASDGHDLSTPDLVRRLAGAMNHPARLVAVPLGLLHVLGAVTGRGAEVRRLCGSLRVDATETLAELGWRAPLEVDEGIERTVRWFLATGRRQ